MRVPLRSQGLSRKRRFAVDAGQHTCSPRGVHGTGFLAACDCHGIVFPPASASGAHPFIRNRRALDFHRHHRRRRRAFFKRASESAHLRRRTTMGLNKDLAVVDLGQSQMDGADATFSATARCLRRPERPVDRCLTVRPCGHTVLARVKPWL